MKSIKSNVNEIDLSKYYSSKTATYKKLDSEYINAYNDKVKSINLSINCVTFNDFIIANEQNNLLKSKQVDERTRKLRMYSLDYSMTMNVKASVSEYEATDKELCSYLIATGKLDSEDNLLSWGKTIRNDDDVKAYMQRICSRRGIDYNLAKKACSNAYKLKYTELCCHYGVDPDTTKACNIRLENTKVRLGIIDSSKVKSNIESKLKPTTIDYNITKEKLLNFTDSMSEEKRRGVTIGLSRDFVGEESEKIKAAVVYLLKDYSIPVVFDDKPIDLNGRLNNKKQIKVTVGQQLKADSMRRGKVIRGLRAVQNVFNCDAYSEQTDIDKDL